MRLDPLFKGIEGSEATALQYLDPFADVAEAAP
jgi:hypothetical protein